MLLGSQSYSVNIRSKQGTLFASHTDFIITHWLSDESVGCEIINQDITEYVCCCWCHCKSHHHHLHHHQYSSTHSSTYHISFVTLLAELCTSGSPFAGYRVVWLLILWLALSSPYPLLFEWKSIRKYTNVPTDLAWGLRPKCVVLFSFQKSWICYIEKKLFHLFLVVHNKIQCFVFHFSDA